MTGLVSWFCLGFAGAELAAAYLPSLVLVPAAAFLVYRLGRRPRRNFSALYVGALLGIIYFSVFTYRNIRPIHSLNMQTVEATAVVGTDAESAYAEGRLRGTLHITELNGQPADLRVSCSSFPGEQPGETFTAQFTFVELAKDRYRLNSYSKGVYMQVEYRGGYRAGPASTDRVFAFYRLRRQLGDILHRWLPKDLDGLEAAMLLSDKSRLSDSIRQDFRTAGISHFLAVSGLHLTLLCAIFAFGSPDRYTLAFIPLRILTVLFYMMLTGMPVSILRAGIVFIIVAIGDITVDPSDLMTNTGIAALLMSLQNPYTPCDIGFQLSFCAIFGIQAAEICEWKLHPITFPIPTYKTKKYVLLALLFTMQSILTAAFTSIATMPVLIAHGMSVSLVGVLTNVLVVWMLLPALEMGTALILISMIPFLLPFTNLLSVLLSLWLKAMLFLVRSCARLPFASIQLPRRYALLVIIVLILLGLAFRRLKVLRFYWPVAVVCTVFAVFMGMQMQRDVVSVAMVGSSGNPSVVCMQNRQAVVFFRGGESNRVAVEDYLAEHPYIRSYTLVDLRTNPTALAFTADSVLTVKDLDAYQSMPLLDGLSLDLYHNSSGNLAVLDAGGRHIAIMAGNIRLSAPVKVDVLCAAGTLSDSVVADTILCNTPVPKWIDRVGDAQLMYGDDDPGLTLRPGSSMIFEEAQAVALQ